METSIIFIVIVNELDPTVYTIVGKNDTDCWEQGIKVFKEIVTNYGYSPSQDDINSGQYIDLAEKFSITLTYPNLITE